ncbi:hypothetical protein J6590_064223 [Homalodisca vitripennis]|nr:hypothetical protein J6590_064223 [Homalodisca vitripennis]
MLYSLGLQYVTIPFANSVSASAPLALRYHVRRLSASLRLVPIRRLAALPNLPPARCRRLRQGDNRVGSTAPPLGVNLLCSYSNFTVCIMTTLHRLYNLAITASG